MPFRFRGTAIGVGGYITAPHNEVIEVQAATALPEIGGHGSAVSLNFRHGDILSFDRAHAEVTGSQTGTDNGQPVYETRVKSTVEGLNIMDIVTADRIVANLFTKFTGEGPGEPTVRLLGSRFENLRIAGIPIIVEQCVDVLDEFNTYSLLRDAYAALTNGKPANQEVRDLFGTDQLRQSLASAPQTVSRWMTQVMQTGPAMPATANGTSRCSLVSSLTPKGGKLAIWGNVIRIEGFGTIRLGEVIVSPLNRAVTMLQVNLGSPTAGGVSVASGADGCDPS